MQHNNSLPLNELIDKMLRAYGLDSKLDEVELISSWERLVGKMIAKHTAEIYLKNKVLHLKMDSSALKQELTMAKSKLIEKLNSDLAKPIVKDIIIK